MSQAVPKQRLSLLSPAWWGLPAKFERFRPGQLETIERVVDSDKRFFGLSAPMGSGKSPIAVATHLKEARGADSHRSGYLTASKPLQTQLLNDFSEIGMTDVRGRNSYRCAEFRNRDVSCEEGHEFRCSYDRKRLTDCPYRAAYHAALDAPLVVTNYWYWMAVREYAEGLGEVDLLICDEAHQLVELLSDHLAVRVKRFPRLSYPALDDHAGWREWGGNQLQRLNRDLTKLRDRMGSIPTTEEITRLRSLNYRIGEMKKVTAVDERWAIDRSSGHYTLTPIWPADYAAPLFDGVGRVLLMSATLTPKTLELLGIPEDQYEYYEMPATFDAQRSPVYFIPGPRVGHRMTEGEEILWLSRIDRILDQRPGLNALIHTRSYTRRDAIMNRSAHGRRMVTHQRRDLEQVVAEFKAATERKSGPVLVSPIIMTGFDFPYDSCRVNIIAKIPFPDNRDCPNLAAARRERDPEWQTHTVIQQLVQAVGRGMRAEDDWCENFVIDGHFRWLVYRNKHLVTVWFLRLIQWVEGALPEPLSKTLNKENQ